MIEKNAPPPSEAEYSEPDSEFAPANLPLKEVMEKIQELKNGEVLHFGNAMEIVRLGNKNILADPAILGRELKEKNKLIPPGTTSEDALKPTKDEENYSHFLIDVPPEDNSDNSTQVSRIGKAMADNVDAIVISHLDADHFDVELILTILQENPQAETYGPFGWKHYLFQHNKNLDEDILSRIHSLRPQREGKTKAYSTAEIDSSVKITSIDFPHLGAPKFVEMTQGFLMESKNTRFLLISDASNSPEVISQVKKLHQEKPLTHLMISGATYNPETIYGIVPAKLANWGREKIEEALSHSAFLPVILASITEGKVPIDIVHHGYYYRSSSDRKYLNFRIPAQQENSEEEQVWYQKLNEQIDTLLENNASTISNLDRMALALKHKPIKFLSDAKFRLHFANKLTSWIKRNKVPQEVINKFGMPQPGEIIKKRD